MGYSQYTNNQEYTDNIAQWDITNDCMLDAVKRKGKAYLASNELPNAALSNPANHQLNEYIKHTYTTRVLPMAVFFNFTASTVSAWVGTIMRKPATIELADNGQDSIIDYLKWNADGSGNGLNQQSRKALESTFAYSGGLFLITPPDKLMSPVSIRDGSVAPRISVFTRRKILDWKYNYINSERQLTYLKLIDGRLSSEGGNIEEETLCIEYFLENGAVYYSITVENDTDDNVIEVDKAELIKAGKQATRIPVHPFGSMDNDLQVDSAPLTVIANKNIEHYQMSSRHQQQCYDAGQGQYHIDLGDTSKGGYETYNAEGEQISGLEALNPGGIKLGSLVPIVTANGGSVNLMQITTDNLLAQEPERLEKQAQKLGAIMMTEQSNETATAARIAASGMSASLTTAADNVSRALTSAIEECGEYASYEYDGIKYELNKELVDTVYTPQDKQADLQLVEANRMPRKSYFDKLKRMGEIDEAMTFDNYLKALEEDVAAHSLGALPVFGNNPDRQV